MVRCRRAHLVLQRQLAMQDAWCGRLKLLCCNQKQQLRARARRRREAPGWKDGTRLFSVVLVPAQELEQF